jgi:uncharacterized peroxidase-related enzyme
VFLSDPPLDPQVRAMYARDLDDDGYVANSTRMWAWRPDVFEAFKHTRVVTGEAMTLTDREFAVLLSATVSAQRDGYCSLAWGTTLSRETSDDVAAAVLTGATPSDLTDRERALVRWCRAVVRDPGATSATDVDRLRAAGFGDRDVFEITAIVAFRIAFSTLRLALGVQPDAQLAEAAGEVVRDAVDFGRGVAQVPSPTTVDPA